MRRAASYGVGMRETATGDVNLCKTVTVDGAAQLTGIGKHAIRDAIAAGKLRAVYIGRRVRIPVVELERFLLEAASVWTNLADFRVARRDTWTSNLPQRRRRIR
jgi:excisionase family DNA binding protein